MEIAGSYKAVGILVHLLNDKASYTRRQFYCENVYFYSAFTKTWAEIVCFWCITKNCLDYEIKDLLTIYCNNRISEYNRAHSVGPNIV